MKMQPQGESGIHEVVGVEKNFAPGGNIGPQAIGGKRLRKNWIPFLLLCVSGFVAAAQPADALSDAEIQGRQLVQKILNQTPPQNSTVTGILRIRGDGGTRSSIPVTFVILAAGANWESIYQAAWTNRAEILCIFHSATAASRYFWETNQLAADPGKLAAAEASVSRQDPLSPLETMTPFAGSDFSLADLGLEFFHWPEQRVLRREIHRSRGCTVLESTNPHPLPDGYARVLSWIDTETLGIVEACAYDARGRELKDFYPKDFKKVDGQWQVQTLVMENAETGSRSRLEFDLKK